MAFLTFYTTIKSPELVSVPGYHNLKPTTKHSLSSPSSSISKSKTNLHSRVYYIARRYQGLIKASSKTMTTEKLGITTVKTPRNRSSLNSASNLGPSESFFFFFLFF
ncbi:hypothetical protein Hanom_Chr01g00020531 [Helianthus anomalus]